MSSELTQLTPLEDTISPAPRNPIEVNKTSGTDKRRKRSGTTRIGHRNMKMVDMTCNEAKSIDYIRIAGGSFLTSSGVVLGYFGKACLQLADKYDAGKYQFLAGETARLVASLVVGIAFMGMGIFLSTRDKGMVEAIKDETDYGDEEV